MATVNYTVFDGEIVEEDRGGTIRGYVPDPLGSTRALLNSSQGIMDSWNYWPYGEVQTSEATTPTPFTFVGTLGYHKDATNRTYVRARFYHPGYGQWMTMDPLWPEELPYCYVHSNPNTDVDPSGLGCWSFKIPFGRSNRSYFFHENCFRLCPSACFGLGIDTTNRLYIAPEDYGLTTSGGVVAACLAACRGNLQCVGICWIIGTLASGLLALCQKTVTKPIGSACIEERIKCNKLEYIGCCKGFGSGITRPPWLPPLPLPVPFPF